MSREGPADRLNQLIREISTETILLHQTVADRLGLNLTDHKALGFLFDAGESLTAGQLASRMGLTTGAVTGIVDRLEQAGFVKRRRHADDRRQVILEVNAAKVQRDLLPIFDQLGKRMAAVAASFSQRDLAVIADFLEQGLGVSRDYRTSLRSSA